MPSPGVVLNRFESDLDNLTLDVSRNVQEVLFQVESDRTPKVSKKINDRLRDLRRLVMKLSALGQKLRAYQADLESRDADKFNNSELPDDSDLDKVEELRREAVDLAQHTTDEINRTENAMD